MLNYRKPAFFVGTVAMVAIVISAVILLTNGAKTIEVLADKETTNTNKINASTNASAKEFLLAQPFELSQATLTIDNKPMTLKLIMSKGKHITDGEIGLDGAGNVGC